MPNVVVKTATVAVIPAGLVVLLGGTDGCVADTTVFFRLPALAPEAWGRCRFKVLL